MRPQRSDDAGSTLVLTIGFAAFALVVTLVVAAATSLYIERKRLLSLADSAALVGAEAFDLEDVRVVEDASGVTVELESASVEAAVIEHVDRVRSTRFEDLRIEEAASRDGRSAVVSLSSSWKPPVLTLFLPDGLRLDATSSARSVLR
ncbi:pilus assembly protein TadG-related protein [Labedella endophytica]|jgi:uncharacterized membrane protein|uniref:Putative Flp pilus-assembly TadG-like N-terminal domain-containing protein n=1 Tax=Labedella endophytica TaxID=1523160 RepID=A0A3S1CPP1_9MICO|nr:pilus assembly protein TadG-related protein [Labedella endophytica]RUQ97688.1 hypothetical protein ELQ94_15990 [Labedella endophytica]